jgi:hypothetical protein
MEFKKLSVGPYTYGIDGHNLKAHMLKRNPNYAKENITNVNFEDE